MEEDHKQLIDTVFDCVIPYIHDVTDRNSFSLVCRKSCEVEGKTRKHLTVHKCYVSTPLRFHQRFPFLESLTLKGKPLAKIFPSHRDGYITPWVREIVTWFHCLKAIHLESLFVYDSDIELLVRTCGNQLTTLNINFCSGFSTDGLFHIGKYCNDLRCLSLQDTRITENDGKWLHEFALHNTRIESLNFYKTEMVKFDVKDLALVAKNCSQSLVSVKISECEHNFIDLADFFSYAVNLEDFGCVFSTSFGDKPDKYIDFKFPPKLKYLSLSCISEIRTILPFAHLLTDIDLQCVVPLDSCDHCVLVQSCPNLQVLYTKNVVGDEVLQLLGKFCKKLRKLFINWTTSRDGSVSHIGLIALAEGCRELEMLNVGVIYVTNEAMNYIGTHLKNLYDFNITFTNKEDKYTCNLPLDIGVGALLIGCDKLERLGISFLGLGGLTDVGLRYIGRYGYNLRYLSLRYSGESDVGLAELQWGCSKLRELIMNNCPFSKEAIDIFICNVTSLRYFLVQGISQHCRRSLAKARPSFKQIY